MTIFKSIDSHIKRVLGQLKLTEEDAVGISNFIIFYAIDVIIITIGLINFIITGYVEILLAGIVVGGLFMALLLFLFAVLYATYLSKKIKDYILENAKK